MMGVTRVVQAVTLRWCSQVVLRKAEHHHYLRYEPRGPTPPSRSFSGCPPRHRLP